MQLFHNPFFIILKKKKPNINHAAICERVWKTLFKLKKKDQIYFLERVLERMLKKR